MTKTTANLLVLCALVGAGASPSLLGCGGGNDKPADTASAASSGSSALLATTPAASASSAAADSSSSAIAAPAASEAPSPLAQVLTTDSGQIQKFYDAAAAAPAATMKDGGAGEPLAKGIREAAMKLPGGMKPEGPAATGSLKEKQHLQTDITLKPGKCYSIVGYSKKVKDLDLYLFLPPGMLSGQDLTDDNKPIIGGPPQPMCPTAATAVTYKLDIFADSGAGDVAVQLFSKGQ